MLECRTYQTVQGVGASLVVELDIQCTWYVDVEMVKESGEDAITLRFEVSLQGELGISGKVVSRNCYDILW